jgi:peptide/nickel transport system substrate-binding protein
LREDVKFADGSPFNATAVKVSIERLIGIGQQSSNFVAVQDIEVVDTYTVKITLEYPFAAFLAVLSTYQGSIVNPNAVAAHSTTEDPWAEDWFAEHTNGTGPYVFTNWKKGESWDLVRNELYWKGWEGPHIDRVRLLVVMERATRRMLLEAGETDLSMNIGHEDLAEMRLNPYIKIVTYPALSTYYFCLNNAKPPLDDVHVRRAISYAFDYQSGLAVIEYLGKISKGTMPSALWAEDPGTLQYTMNMTKAKEELAQSAYPDGGFTLQYLCPTGATQIRMGEILQANLRELNINVEIVSQPWATLVATTTNPETAMDIVGIYEFISAPDPHVSLFWRFHSSMQPHIKGGYNWAYYNNSQIDELLEAGMVEQDPETRINIYKQIDQLLLEDASMIYCWEQQRFEPMGSWVHGFFANPARVQTYPYYYMYIRPEDKP